MRDFEKEKMEIADEIKRRGLMNQSPCQKERHGTCQKRSCSCQKAFQEPGYHLAHPFQAGQTPTSGDLPASKNKGEKEPSVSIVLGDYGTCGVHGDTIQELLKRLHVQTRHRPRGLPASIRHPSAFESILLGVAVRCLRHTARIEVQFHNDLTYEDYTTPKRDCKIKTQKEAVQEREQKRRDEICNRNFEMLAKGWKPRAKRESSASCSFEKDIEALQKDFP